MVYISQLFMLRNTERDQDVSSDCVKVLSLFSEVYPIAFII